MKMEIYETNLYNTQYNSIMSLIDLSGELTQQTNYMVSILNNYLSTLADVNELFGNITLVGDNA